MIDLHCHILPGLDDGAKTLAESLEMGRIAARDGVTGIVATPHAFNDTYENNRQNILPAVESLRAAFLEAQIPVTLYPGADVRITERLVDHIKNGEALTLNDTGKYIFIELPSQVIPMHIADFIFQLQLAGVTPVVTHPERNVFIEKDPNILYEFISKGALAQITAGSLCGMFGAGARDTAKKLLKCNMAHVIASDAHSPVTRPPVLSAGVKVAARIAGTEEADAMVRETPGKIIAGEYVNTPEPERYRSFFSFFTA